jgi:hypothetical protein
MGCGCSRNTTPIKIVPISHQTTPRQTAGCHTSVLPNARSNSPKSDPQNKPGLINPDPEPPFRSEATIKPAIKTQTMESNAWERLPLTPEINFQSNDENYFQGQSNSGGKFQTALETHIHPISSRFDSPATIEMQKAWLPLSDVSPSNISTIKAGSSFFIFLFQNKQSP